MDAADRTLALFDENYETAFAESVAHSQAPPMVEQPIARCVIVTEFQEEEDEELFPPSWVTGILDSERANERNR